VFKRSFLCSNGFFCASRWGKDKGEGEKEKERLSDTRDKLYEMPKTTLQIMISAIHFQWRI